MLKFRAHPEAIRPRTAHPVRQVQVFLGITYVLAIAIALALPHAGIAPLLSIAVPVIAVAVTVAVTVPRGQRGAVWAAVGFGPPRWSAVLVAVLGPVVFVCLSFGIAAVFGVVRFPAIGLGISNDVLNFVVSAAIFMVVFLGEEIGWRGYMLLRLAEVTSPRRAALLTGACHAVFHLPLLLLTTTYQSAGNRWIVVPMVMVTLTAAGVWYAWLRSWSGSIWAVSLSHGGFNNIAEGLGGAVIATSPTTMAYVTTETGVVTMIIILLLAGYLWTRRAADFDKLRPTRSDAVGQPLGGPPL